MGPLQGLKVLDLTRILAGPWSTQVLADFGATVWKIEKPGGGDDTRQWGPPWLKDEAGQDTRESAYYLSANRGKYSVAVDITTPEGQRIIQRMVAEADILVENFKVGGLKKYGLDYATLTAINPALIYCSITGFGQTGPDAHKAGYDAMIQGRGGLMSITGEADEQGGSPQKAGVAVADLMTGMYAVSGILAALYHREKTGEGQHIDLALLDTQVAWLANQNMNYLVGHQVPQRQGTSHPNIVPYQVFKSQDGYLMLAVGNDGQFKRAVKAMGLEILGNDARFLTNADRVKHRDLLVPAIELALSGNTTEYWIDTFGKVTVPCGPVNQLDQVFADPQIVARDMSFSLEHPTAGSVPMVANPLKFSRTSISYQKAPPTLGEDTEAILSSVMKASFSEKNNL